MVRGPNPRAGAAMVPFAGLLAALEGIADPRRRQGRRYPPAHLLLFSVLAVLAGATSYRGILTFIGVHRERLNAVFGARFRRAPAVNTLRGLFLALEPAELEAAFREHARALAEKAPAPGPRVVALDGKTLKRSFDHLNDQAAAHVLSAFAGEAALILAHQEVRAAPEEVPAAQALIGGLGGAGGPVSRRAPRRARRPVHRRRSPLPKKPSRAPPAPAAPCWSGSRPTSPACMTRSRGSAPSGSRSTGTRRRTAAGTAPRSTGASRSSRWRAGSRRDGGGRSPARPASRA